VEVRLNAMLLIVTCKVFTRYGGTDVGGGGQAVGMCYRLECNVDVE
jgi:hypothetical protein